MVDIGSLIVAVLGLIFAMFVQILVVVYYGGRIVKSVEHHDKAIDKLQTHWDNGIAKLLRAGVTALEELVEFLRRGNVHSGG